jgi:hypothetical protein
MDKIDVRCPARLETTLTAVRSASTTIKIFRHLSISVFQKTSRQLYRMSAEMSKASSTTAGNELSSATQDPQFKQTSDSVQRLGTSARDLILDQRFRDFVNGALSAMDDLQSWPGLMRPAFGNHRLMNQWRNLIDSAFDDFPMTIERISDFPRLSSAMTSFRDAFGSDWQNFWRAGQDWNRAVESMDQALRRDFQNMLKYVPKDDVAKETIRRFDESSAFDAWNKFAQESRSMIDALSKNMESRGWDDLVNQFIVKQDGKVTGVNLEAFSKASEMIPVLFQSIQNVEVPRVEIHFEDSRIVADNIRLQPNTFNPNQVSLNTESSIVNLQSEFHVEANATTRVNLENVAYMYFNKTFVEGDVGKMDCEFDIQLRTRFRVHGYDAITKSSPALVKENLKTKISNLNIKVTKSEHENLNTVLKPIIQEQIKNQMEKYIDNSLNDWFNQFNKALTDGIRGSVAAASGA